jgi:hypothetical protein
MSKDNEVRIVNETSNALDWLKKSVTFTKGEVVGQPRKEMVISYNSVSRKVGIGGTKLG